MNFGMGNTQGCLRNHPGFFGVFDGEFEVTVVVEAAERSGNVNPLSLLHLIHQATHIGRNGKHTDTVQGTLEHVGLNAGIVKGFGPLTYGGVGVFSIEEVHLFEGTSVGLDTGKTSHIDYHGGYFI